MSTLYDAVTTLDFEEVGEEEEIRALQTLINGGVWGLRPPGPWDDFPARKREEPRVFGQGPA